MARLCQVVAAEQTARAQGKAAIEAAYHRAQRPPLFSGQIRTYTPRVEGGDELPGESKLVQASVPDLITSTRAALVRMWDVAATRETANTRARADVIVDGVTVLADVPVGVLLYLEKQLTDLRTFLAELPTLDPATAWSWDSVRGCYVSPPVGTVRTRKVMRNHVKYAATDKHPAQVDTYTEDEIVGDWTTVHLSGAVPAQQVAALIRRVETLRDAVKAAREEANTMTVDDKPIGAAVFDFVFGTAAA